MNVRQHQYLDVALVLFFVLLCVESVIFGNKILDYLSWAATSFMTLSIAVGLFLEAYIKLTRKSIFDPLESELDEDPDDLGVGLRPS